jgi:DNA-binding NarL/FixJ family response regulator
MKHSDLYVYRPLDVRIWSAHQAPAHSSQVDSAVAPAVDRPLPAARLRKRQLQVLILAAQGKRSQEIADALDLSVSTVQAHFARVFRTLGVSNRTAAVQAAGVAHWMRSSALMGEVPRTKRAPHAIGAEAQPVCGSALTT